MKEQNYDYCLVPVLSVFHVMTYHAAFVPRLIHLSML